jgi:hypothetical protein
MLFVNISGGRKSGHFQEFIANLPGNLKGPIRTDAAPEK